MRLFQHFSVFYAAQAGVAPCSLDAGAQAVWNRYAFPGNVRELRNITIRLVTKHPGTSVGESALQEELDLGADLAADLPQARDFDASPEVAVAVLAERHGIDLNQALRAWERCFVDAAMKLAHGNLSAAARLLGMHRTTLYSRIQALEADTDKAVRPRPAGAEQP